MQCSVLQCSVECRRANVTMLHCVFVAVVQCSVLQCSVEWCRGSVLCDGVVLCFAGAVPCGVLQCSIEWCRGSAVSYMAM